MSKWTFRRRLAAVLFWSGSLSQALANGGGGHGGGHGSFGGGHGSSGAHGAAGYHGGTSHLVSTWGSWHSAPGYHSFATKPSVPYTVGRLGRAAGTDAGHAGAAGQGSVTASAEAELGASPRETALNAGTFGPIRPTAPVLAVPPGSSLPADTTSPEQPLPGLTPEPAEKLPPPRPVNSDGFWLVYAGVALLVGGGVYLRWWRPTASQRPAA